MCSIPPITSIAQVIKWGGLISRVKTTEKAFSPCFNSKTVFQIVMQKTPPQNKEKQISRVD